MSADILSHYDEPDTEITLEAIVVREGDDEVPLWQAHVHVGEDGWNARGDTRAEALSEAGKILAKDKEGE